MRTVRINRRLQELLATASVVSVLHAYGGGKKLGGGRIEYAKLP